MQHLLDFVHEHTLEEQLYLVVDTASGPLEMLWQRSHQADSWQLRPHKAEVAFENVARSALLDTLRARGANMERVERELRAIVMTQIAFADMLLRDADAALGRELVQTAVSGHREFMNQLQSAITELVIRPAQNKPRMKVLNGGGAQSETRSGHLRVI
jgi:hypothetical protein